jgi:hypothetical protein
LIIVLASNFLKQFWLKPFPATQQQQQQQQEQ